jgi:F0F1-type ATP synthase membrane subunit c/vacuolar-type H+-ATPase subunit K
MLNKKMKALIAVLSVSLAIGLAALGAGIISSKVSGASGSAVASTTSTSSGSSSDN